MGVLSGVLVVDERENIAPGFKQDLKTRLEAGDYQITCGLVSNPKGKLIVLPSADSTASAAGPVTGNDLIGPEVEYRVKTARIVSEMGPMLSILKDAVAKGDLESAKLAFEKVRSSFLQAAPLWPQSGDSASALVADLPEIGAKLYDGQPTPGLEGILTRTTTEAEEFRIASRAAIPEASALLKEAVLIARHLFDGAAEEATPQNAGCQNSILLNYLLDDRSGPQTAVVADLVDGIERVTARFLPLVGKVRPAAAANVTSAIARFRVQLAAASDHSRRFNSDLTASQLDGLRAAAADVASSVAQMTIVLGLEAKEAKQ